MAKIKKKEVVIDVLKKGSGIEKMVNIEVGGARLGTIHLGSEEAVGNPKRVIFNLNPYFFHSCYNVTEIDAGGNKCQMGPGPSLLIIMKKTHSRRREEKD